MRRIGDDVDELHDCELRIVLSDLFLSIQMKFNNGSSFRFDALCFLENIKKNYFDCCYVGIATLSWTYTSVHKCACIICLRWYEMGWDGMRWFEMRFPRFSGCSYSASCRLCILPVVGGTTWPCRNQEWNQTVRQADWFLLLLFMFMITPAHFQQDSSCEIDSNEAFVQLHFVSTKMKCKRIKYLLTETRNK